MRAGTAYGTARRLIKVLAGVALLALAIVCIGTVFERSVRTEVRLGALFVLALEAFAVIVSAAILQAVLDIADCNLRRDH